MSKIKDRKIHIYLRSCRLLERTNRSEPKWFSKSLAFKNLLSNTKMEQIELEIFFDGNKDQLYSEELLKFPIQYGTYGSDEKSYQALISHILSKGHNDEDIIYILEDDYLHKKGWEKIMLEGFDELDARMLTLYDHPDKYNGKSYEFLQSSVKRTTSTHWRTTPSTTNTFAFKFEVLKAHADIFKSHWLDHEKFLNLWSRGIAFYSVLPGYSTHCLKNCLSPGTDWEKEITYE